MKKAVLGVLLAVSSTSAFAGTFQCETALVSISGVTKSVSETPTKNGIARLNLGTTTTGYELEAFYSEALGIVAITAKTDTIEISSNGNQTAFLKVSAPGMELTPTVEVSCEARN